MNDPCAASARSRVGADGTLSFSCEELNFALAQLVHTWPLFCGPQEGSLHIFKEFGVRSN